MKFLPETETNPGGVEPVVVVVDVSVVVVVVLPVAETAATAIDAYKKTLSIVPNEKRQVEDANPAEVQLRGELHENTNQGHDTASIKCSISYRRSRTNILLFSKLFIGYSS
jgi:hypothetical protein